METQQIFDLKDECCSIVIHLINFSIPFQRLIKFISFRQ